MTKIIPTNNKYNMIVAADTDWCIGNNGRLLTHIPEDMKLFKNMTTGKMIIMGRKTQESLPNALFLNNRINVVLSNKFGNNTTVHYDDAVVHYNTNITDALSFIDECNNILKTDPDKCKFDYITDSDVFIIGGAQIYKQFLENDLISTIYLTRIHHKFTGDTFIPNLYEYGFKEVGNSKPKYTNDGIAYSFSILEK